MAKTKLKFSRGLEKELPIKYSDGEIHFCTDTGALFIDNATGRTKIAAGKADKADKLTTARVITLAGDVTGSVNFDGSKAVTIATTVKDDSHNHIIDNIDELQNVLDAKAPIEFSTNYTNKKKWTAVTKVGSYSRLCQVTGYGNFLFSITLSQNSQVSIYTFAIGFGWQSAEIHCIASTGYSANDNQILRITRPSDSGDVYYIEILNNFSHDSAITKNCICTIHELQGSELIKNVVSYTDYTATDETHIEEASCETQYNGIVAPNFYGNATSSTTATTAATATKLSTSAGSTTQPVYFKDGKPVVTTYALNKTVPADAKFTDTTYNNFVKSGSGSKAGLVPAPPTTAGTTKYLREDGTWAVPPNTTYSLASFGITASATELNYTKGVTSSIQTQLNKKLNSAGGVLTGAVSINRTAANKTKPSNQDLVINYTLSSGDSLTEKNAPGIGFHISDKSWASFIYDGKFKFINSDFTDYASVQASSFIGNLTGTASKATADANGNNIANTYATKATVNANFAKSITGLSVSGQTITYTKGDGSTGTIKTQDTNTTYTFNGAVSTIKDNNLIANRALISNGSGKVAVSNITSTELGYLSGLTGSIKNSLSNKVPYVGTTPVSGEASAFYCKLCTVTIPKGYCDIYFEFDLVGRTTQRFQTIKCAVTKVNTFALNDAKIFVSGNNSNIYEVVGYKNVITSDSVGDTFELWCKVPVYDQLNVFHRKVGGLTYGSQTKIQDWITWEYTKNTALPTESSTKVKVSASLEAWQGNAKTATTATKLSTSAGSATKPIYFKDGKPVACTHTLEASVPSGALFTDTTYSAATTSADGLMTADMVTKLNGIATGANKYILPNATSSALGGVKIGSNITVSSGTISLTKENVTAALGYTPPTANTTYSIATASAAGLVKPISVITKPTINSTTTTSGRYYSIQMSSDGNMFVNVPWGYSAATTSVAGLMSAEDKKRLNSVVGSTTLSIPNRTITELRAALDDWLDTYKNFAHATATFSGSANWIDKWNDGDLTTAFNAGGKWTVTVIASYSENTYVHLRFAYYNDQDIVYVVKFNNVWQPARKVAFKNKLSDGTVGSSSKPIYLNNGVPTECGTLSLSTTGNAASATKFATARTISISSTAGTTGTSFNGTANISLVIPTSLTNLNRLTFATSDNTFSPTAQSIVLNGVNGSDDNAKAPGIGFHIGNKNWASLKFLPDGSFRFYNNGGTGYQPVYASTFYGNLSGNATTATKATQDGSGNTITSTYLKLSGGTLSGKLTASGKISVPTSGSSWISGMTIGNASIAISTQNSSGSYHPIIAGKTYNGHIWNLGTYVDNIGFYGFKSGRTENATDWSFAINVSSGAINASGSITAASFHGSGSGLTSLNASKVSSGTLAVARGGTGITSNPSMLINLGSTSAANVFATSPRPGITGTLGLANGGTGKTTAKDAANAFINALDTGSSAPVDADYYICQYAGGGTSTTTYHRRPTSALWTYMKGKIDTTYYKTVTKSGAIGSVTLADKTDYIYTGVTSLTLVYPSGNFECWLSVTTSTSAITLSFPSGTKFIGTSITSLAANTTYEISIKNKVVIIKKVG